MSAIKGSPKPDSPAAALPAMGKLFVMLPVMYLSRKLDGEDENVIFLLRCLYGTVQVSLILGIAYIIQKVQKMSSKPWMQACVVYVPMPVPPFPPPAPDAKKQYKESTLSKTILSTAYSLLKSSATGACITVALHLYKGMIVGLAMQSAMGPFNLYDSKLAKTVLLNQCGDGSPNAWRKLRVFDEKYEGELTTQDELIDDEGNLIKFKESNIQDVLRDTWDNGEKADIGPLLSMLTDSNINMKTDKLGWTPIMVMASINVKNSIDALADMKKMGADPTISDEEGWNALHWAAFHGCVEGVKFLLKEYAGKGLENAKDKEGKVPLDHAKAEDNPDVVKAIEQILRKTQ